MIRIAFAGQPNCGKSTLFNMMTGSHQHVANYPGITVEKKTGDYVFEQNEVFITDLPGTYSLTSYSPEERVTRDFILNERPDAVVNVSDASNLERHLYLTFQLLEMKRPLIMYVNKLDAAQAAGLRIDADALSNELGVPVITGSAKYKQHVTDLRRLIATVGTNSSYKQDFTLNYGEEMESVINTIVSKLEKARKADTDNSMPLRWIAVKLCEHDTKVVADARAQFNDFDGIVKGVEELEALYKERTKRSFEIAIALVRAKEAHRIVERCISKEKVGAAEIKKQDTKKTLFALSGAAVLALVTYYILYSVFGFIHSLDAFFAVKVAASALAAAGFTAGAVAIYRGGGSVINSTDRVDRVLCHRVYGPLILVELILVFYWITVILGYKLTDLVFPFFRFTRALVSQLVPSVSLLDSGPLRGLLLNGVIDGAIMILNYVPIFLCLFALVAFMEDVGYMARLAFIMDRILRKFGLHGQSTLPMILSGVIMGGCVVPGVMSTRTIRDDKSRLVTILILPLLNCMAKIPFYVLVTGIFFASRQWLVLGGLSLFTLIVALVAAKFFSSYVVPGKAEPFVLELPAYNMPTLSGVAIRTWERLWSFIKKVATTVVAVSVVIWVGVSFPSLNKQKKAEFNAQKDERIERFKKTLNNPYARYVGTDKHLVQYMQFEEKYSLANSLNWFGKDEGAEKINARFFLENPEFAKILMKGKITLGQNMPLFKSYYASYTAEKAAFEAEYALAASEDRKQEVKQAFYGKWMKANPYFFAIVRTGTLTFKGDSVIDEDAKKANKEMRSLFADIKTIGRAVHKETLEHSALGFLGKALEPVSRFAGFDWKINIAVLGAFAAKEALVSTLGTIYSVEAGGNDGKELEARIKNNETGMTALDGLVIMLLISLFPPCIATMMAIKTETQSWLWMAFSVLYPVALGGILATLVFQIGRLLGF